MRKSTIVLVVLSLGFLSLAIWSWDKLNFSPVSKTHLRLSLDNKVESLDPAKAYSDDSLFVSAQVLEPLYQYHYLKRPYELQPLIAEGFPKVSNKGKLVVVHLKKNIFFHPHPAFENKTRELVAEDFVTQFKRLALEELKSPGRGIFTGLIEGFQDYNSLVEGNWENLPKFPMKGVRALDKYSLEIELLKSEPNINYYLALNFLSPVPWELVKYTGNKLDNILLGTGPYIYQGEDSNSLMMNKNEKYRDAFYPTSGDRYANVQKLLSSSKEKIPFIDSIRFEVVNNEKERWDKFFNRKFDLLTVPKTYIDQLYDEKGELGSEIKKRELELKHFPILANRWLAFNMKDPLLGKNKSIRQAIAYAINYDEYIKLLSSNTNLRANSILVPGISGYMPAKDFRFLYDPEKAKLILKEAGFASPSEVPKIVYSTRGTQAVNIQEANFIKEQLEKIGLKVEIEILPFSEFLQKGRAGQLMFFTDNWLFDYPDGENILQLLYSANFPGVNKSGYSNERVDELYNQLKMTTNLDQRDKIFHEMEELIFEDLPWIPMMYESSFVLHYPDIKNFRKSSIIRNYVKYLKIQN